MRTNIRFLGLAAVAAGAFFATQNASAICGSAIIYGEAVGYLVTPTGNPASIRSNFWVLNNGNPTFGLGKDNGNAADNGSIPWIKPYGSGIYVNGDWAQNTAYDGCPDDIGPPTVQQMVFSFSDVDGSNQAFLGIACLGRNTLVTNQFNIDTTVGGGNFTLTPMPKAAITNTVRAGNEATITVGSPDFSGNVHTDGNPACTLAAIVPQYDVYVQQLARNAAAPTARDTNGWTLAGTGNTGSPFTFTTTCGTTNCDVYVAVAPHLNSGFTDGEAATGQVARVGANSTKVQAGPTLAETPKFKIIGNPGAGAKPKTPINQ